VQPMDSFNQSRSLEEDATVQHSDVREEISTVRDSLSQMRTELSRTRQRIDRRDVEIESHVRHSRAMWVLMVLATAGFATYLWYGGVPWIGDNNAMARRLPAIQKLVDGATERLATVEQKVNSWVQVRDSFDHRITGLERSKSAPADNRVLRERAVPANDRGVQKMAADAAAGVQDANENIRSLQSRLGDVASREQETGDGLNRLSGDIAGLRNEVRIMRKDYGDQIDQVQRENANRTGSISSIDRKLNSNSSELHLLSDSVNRDRVDFEVVHNQTEEVAPGIFLTVRDTDVEHQRINGWLQIAEDGRTVVIRDQGAQKVMAFNTRGDSRSRELVFTFIGKNGVAGYMLIPVAKAG